MPEAETLQFRFNEAADKLQKRIGIGREETRNEVLNTILEYCERIEEFYKQKEELARLDTNAQETETETSNSPNVSEDTHDKLRSKPPFNFSRTLLIILGFLFLVFILLIVSVIYLNTNNMKTSLINSLSNRTPNQTPSLMPTPTHPVYGSLSTTSSPQPGTITTTSIPVAATALSGASWPNLGTPTLSEPYLQDWENYGHSGGFDRCAFVDGEGLYSYAGNFGAGHCGLLTQTWMNVAFEADYKILQGGTPDGIEMTVDDNDNGTYYGFQISSNQYTVHRLVNSTALSSPFASGTVPNMNASTNKIGIIAQGSTIIVYVNHVRIDVINDVHLAGGYVEIGAYAKSDPEIEILMTNAKIWKLQ